MGIKDSGLFRRWAKKAFDEIGGCCVSLATLGEGSYSRGGDRAVAGQIAVPGSCSYCH